ncbi:MAG TPA: hypothetical protein VIW45_02125 [Vicinamibacterales bacterium]|jgi:hypothetical protein
MVQTLDSALLDVIEWLCRRFQWLTGRTNLWLAVQLTNVNIIVYFVWAALYFWRADLATRLFVGAFCGSVLWALTRTVLRDPIELYESHAFRRVANGQRNPRRMRDVSLRISFLTLAVLLFGPVAFVYLTLHPIVVLLGYSLIVLTTMVLYLLACDPLPPCAGRVREWLSATAPARGLAEPRRSLHEPAESSTRSESLR